MFSGYSAPKVEDEDGKQNEALSIQEEMASDLLCYLAKKAMAFWFVPAIVQPAGPGQ